MIARTSFFALLGTMAEEDEKEQIVRASLQFDYIRSTVWIPFECRNHLDVVQIWPSHSSDIHEVELSLLNSSSFESNETTWSPRKCFTFQSVGFSGAMLTPEFRGSECPRCS